MRYAFKKTVSAAVNSIPDLDPQAIGEYITDLIAKSNEHVGPDEILADAQKSNSPLHKAFEWSDSKAAERWRRRQARHLLGNLVVAKRGKPTKTRAFVYVAHPEHEGRHVYINIRSAMGRPEFREQVIEQAVRSLERWLNFYGPQLGRRRSLVGDVERLKAKIQRELLAAI